MLGQVGQDLGLPLKVQSQFSLADKIIAFEPLPPQWNHLKKDSRTQLVGRRFSVGWSRGTTLPGMAWDTLLYDGYGPYSMAGVFTDKDPLRWIEQLKEHFSEYCAGLPSGPVSAQQKTLWEERKELAMRYGQWISIEDSYSIAILPKEHFRPYPTCRTLVFHPVKSPQQAYDVLKPWQPWLQRIGTDVALETDRLALSPLYNLGDVCYMGFVQSPSMQQRMFMDGEIDS